MCVPSAMLQVTQLTPSSTVHATQWLEGTPSRQVFLQERSQTGGKWLIGWWADIPQITEWWTWLVSTSQWKDSLCSSTFTFLHIFTTLNITKVTWTSAWFDDGDNLWKYMCHLAITYKSLLCYFHKCSHLLL